MDLRGAARRRRAVLPVVVALAALLTLGLAPTTSAAPRPAPAGPAAAPLQPSAQAFVPSKVRAPLARVTGMNLGSLDRPPARGQVRHVRLWDAGVTWAEVEKAPGVYDWSRLDAYVAWARRTGVSTLLVLGPGPHFYSPRSRKLAWVPGSAVVPPRTMKPWLRYVTAVVTRYRGRIDAYEPWNEVNLNMFYGGTPMQMAAMTRAVSRIVERHDRRAIVTSPSVTPSSQYSRRLAARQLKAQAAMGWPFEVYNTHTYSSLGTGVEGARLNNAWYLHVIRRLKAPAKPVWSTEVNLNEPTAPPLNLARTRAIMTRITVDAMMLGFSRLYWYAWHADLPNLPVKLGPSRPGGRVLSGWAGSSAWRLSGCTLGAVYRCRFRAEGARARVVLVPRVAVSAG